MPATRLKSRTRFLLAKAKLRKQTTHKLARPLIAKQLKALKGAGLHRS